MLYPDSTDDYVSISNGFLYAGSRCVISALWTVPDLSTALLMDRFHCELQQHKSPAAALQKAQHWLREEIKSGPDLVNRVLPSFLSNLDDPHLQTECIRAAQKLVDHFPESAPFASPVHWASFTATGMAF